jgi:hypothetical protein
MNIEDVRGKLDVLASNEHQLNILASRQQNFHRVWVGENGLMAAVTPERGSIRTSSK